MNKFKILIVEDSPEYLLYLKKILSLDFSVETASTITQASDCITKNHFDLLLLDINLGEENGFELGRLVKETEHNQNSATIYLTSRSSIIDKITGFSLGADDFIIKPVDSFELIARVKAILRRTSQISLQNEVFESSGVKLNWSAQRVFIQHDGDYKEIFFTLTEKKILRELMANNGRVVSRDRLLNVAWGESLAIIDRNVDAHIYSIRKKINQYSVYIKTVSGIGYRFAVEN